MCVCGQVSDALDNVRALVKHLKPQSCDGACLVRPRLSPSLPLSLPQNAIRGLVSSLRSLLYGLRALVVCLDVAAGSQEAMGRQMLAVFAMCGMYITNVSHALPSLRAPLALLAWRPRPMCGIIRCTIIRCTISIA
eukprot:443138-Rhodomonas_salina.3